MITFTQTRSNKATVLFCAALMLTTTVAYGETDAPSRPSQVSHVHFSVQPTAAEIFRARVFDEPLLPIANSSAAENAALARALETYSARTNSDDFSSIVDFLARHPQSSWRASLLLHLGVEYYNSGYYSRALESWEQAWNEFQNTSEGPAKAQADRALGELALMYSRLGRMNQLDSLLESVKQRELIGPGTALVAAAKSAASLMHDHPELSFRCGPLALESIRTYKRPDIASQPALLVAESTTNGFSLDHLARLAAEVGFDYRMVFRSKHSEIPIPCVVHWKSGHYAAILDRDGDRFLTQDFTFRTRIWISTAALEDEASGYFLAPRSQNISGWRDVSLYEAANIFGKGVTGGGDPGGSGPHDPAGGGDGNGDNNGDGDDDGNGGGDNGNGDNGGGPCGMAGYTFHLMLVDLTIRDTPLRYRPPLGRSIRFSVTYNQFEANQPASFYYSNLGQKWTCNWIAFITDNPTSPNADVSFYEDGGGTLNFTGINTSSQSYQPEMLSQALLIKTSSASYEMRMPNGSKKIFSRSDGATGTTRRIFLTQKIDPRGNTITVNYDSQLRITNIVDAIGQTTTLLYTNPVYSNSITGVVDPFGRTAYFQYNSSGLLTNVADVLGLNSTFTYGANQFITTLTTPYGTTTFTTSGGIQGWLEATDPLGQKERLEFNQGAPTPASDSVATLPHGLGLFNQYLNARNSYYWSKKAYADAAGDYSKSKLYHWLHEPNITTCSRVLESVKQPLESRVWYNYPGQVQSYPYAIGAGSMARPSVIGRVLDDGTTQRYSYQYNSLGNITNSVDPVGRTFSYIYSTNNVDLLETRMTHNGKNELLNKRTYNQQHRPLTISDASGQTTTNTYNARGQILTTSNPKGELTTYSYDSNGYLTNIVGHLQNAGDVTSFTYDSAGRVHTRTDTEGYTLTYNYDVFDRLTKITHPDGTFEQFVYDKLDLVASCDRIGRWTTNTFDALRHLIQIQDPLGRVTRYGWCRCGALTSLTDAMGRSTTWDYDVESRPAAKHYVDGSMINYTYENTTSRLKNRRDEKGQDIVYEYYPDNNLKRVSYPNAIVPTPTVFYTYDPDYNRVLTMQDGIGTTTYTYNAITIPASLGATHLASVSGPMPNSTVTYQYDQLNRVVNRSINGVAMAATYDALGRLTIVTNTLGTFGYSYVGATARPAVESYPNGQTNLYTYYDTLGDERLSQILHLKPDGALLSSFSYAYNPVGQIAFWTNQTDTASPRWLIADYDAGDELTNAVRTDGATVFNSYSYAYDRAGNRLQSQVNGVTTQYSYNALNELTASVPVQTNSATYEWDAENRLVAINQGTNRSEFSYDGLGRRLRIVEKVNSVAQTDKYYFWCGTKICEERDSSGSVVSRRFFAQGEALVGVMGSTNYFYTRDHLGSVSETIDANGILAARFAYDPFGQKSAILDNLQTTFGFSGDFVHQKTGLCLTWFRVLDTTQGRWLSKDPLGEKVSKNLYTYVRNCPVKLTDKYGLQDSGDRCSPDRPDPNPAPPAPPPNPTFDPSQLGDQLSEGHPDPGSIQNPTGGMSQEQADNSESAQDDEGRLWDTLFGGWVSNGGFGGSPKGEGLELPEGL